MSYYKKGELIFIKYFHTTKKCVISIPAILLSSFRYLDDPEQNVFQVLIIEPISITPIIFETTTIHPS